MVWERWSDVSPFSHSACAFHFQRMPIHPSTTRVPDRILDLATNLAAVDVSQPSQRTPLVFGDFTGVTMPPRIGETFLETLADQVKVTYDKHYGVVSVLLMQLQMTVVSLLFAPLSAAHQTLSWQRSTLVTSGSMSLSRSSLLLCSTTCIACNCHLTILLHATLCLAILCHC